MNRPTGSLDIFSPEAYLDEAEVSRRCKDLRAQGRVLWIEQAAYRSFWAVPGRDEIMAVERDSKTWLAAPRRTLIASDIEDSIVAQWGVRTGPVRTLLDVDGAEHRDHRNLTQSWFNSAFLETLRERMARLAGESACLMYLSGNRDEAPFPDSDVFRVDRAPNRHVAFGYGAHHCLGRILAEMEALFREIIARVESVDLAGEPEWFKTNHTGGLKHLPIRCRMKRGARSQR